MNADSAGPGTSTSSVGPRTSTDSAEPREVDLIEIRMTEPSDADVIARIEEDRYGRDSWSANQVREEIAGIGGTRWYATAVVGGTIAGYVGLFLAPPDADIQTLTVAREYSRRGIGRLLLTKAVAAAKENACQRIFLEVRADNEAALGLYRSFGFDRIGVRRGYYADGGDAVNMRLRLSETTLQEVLR